MANEMNIVFDNPRRKKKGTKKRKALTKKRAHKRKKNMMGDASLLGKKSRKVSKLRKSISVVGKKRKAHKRYSGEALSGKSHKRKSYAGKKHYSTRGDLGKKRRSYSSKKRHSGKRSSFLGQSLNLNFHGIFDELFSYSQMFVGALGGLVAESFITEKLLGTKDSTGNVSVKHSDKAIGAGLTFLGLHFAESWIRPSGFLQNAFTGAKFGAIFTGLMQVYDVLVNGVPWSSDADVISTDTTIQRRITSGLMGNKALMGESYYIDDTGDTYSLGARALPALGARALPAMGATSITDQEMNKAVESLMSGALGAGATPAYANQVKSIYR